MVVQVRCLDARMATVLMSSLILATINGGFHDGIMIISALDPMCGAANELFCSLTDLTIPRTIRGKMILQLPSISKCTPVYENDPPPAGAVPLAYTHSSCADENDPNCGVCLDRATGLVNQNCRGKDGAQFGTEECCVRYEKTNFCGAII